MEKLNTNFPSNKLSKQISDQFNMRIEGTSPAISLPALQK